MSFADSEGKNQRAPEAASQPYRGIGKGNRFTEEANATAIPLTPPIEEEHNRDPGLERPDHSPQTGRRRRHQRHTAVSA